MTITDIHSEFVKQYLKTFTQILNETAYKLSFLNIFFLDIKRKKLDTSPVMKVRIEAWGLHIKT